MCEFITPPTNIAVYQPPTVTDRNVKFLISCWIKEMEGDFHANPYPIETKVRFALDLLRHATKSFWDLIVQSIMITEVETMSWDKFTTRFSERFLLGPQYVASGG